ncbi:hypothetical protein BT63DRAFT_416742 [Microthyrium microscopicum]|uniref:Uncharacterized protein n=1 Tax=Microthyrium microscopicum TaxID=703497 RepID=A0A6A6U5F7_9PEZI|nr:hypothetical protein BT63DRAFT_416742 [Microthyrium microscopicum]
MSPFAYTTVCSSDAHLEPIIVLATTLRTHKSYLPFIILLPPGLSTTTEDALRAESQALQITIEHVGDTLRKRHSYTQTKLPRGLPSLYMFASPLWEYETVCYLAPNSIILRSGLDLIFQEAQLPSDNWLGATPACICLLSTSPSSAKGKRVVHPSADNSSEPPKCPYAKPRVERKASFGWYMPPSPQSTTSEAASDALDPGLLIFYPGERLWHTVLSATVAAIVGGVETPREADLLNGLFREKWQVLPESYFGGGFTCRERGWLDENKRVTCVVGVVGEGEGVLRRVYEGVLERIKRRERSVVMPLREGEVQRRSVFEDKFTFAFLQSSDSQVTNLSQSTTYDFSQQQTVQTALFLHYRSLYAAYAS